MNKVLKTQNGSKDGQEIEVVEGLNFFYRGMNQSGKSFGVVFEDNSIGWMGWAANPTDDNGNFVLKNGHCYKVTANISITKQLNGSEIKEIRAIFAIEETSLTEYVNAAKKNKISISYTHAATAPKVARSAAELIND